MMDRDLVAVVPVAVGLLVAFRTDEDEDNGDVGDCG